MGSSRQPAAPPAGHSIALVDAGRCTACGMCVAACPEKAISIDGVAKVDSLLCVGCWACLPECPNEALAPGNAAPERGATA